MRRPATPSARFSRSPKLRPDRYACHPYDPNFLHLLLRKAMHLPPAAASATSNPSPPLSPLPPSPSSPAPMLSPPPRARAFSPTAFFLLSLGLLPPASAR
ncbi:hypothetical protein PUN28_014987 [Cardiocondyla obscurior]|uniref:Uncharacterized protein n=1 Tax=Cardiocondyla obscurior TaxID=286306 RepID=A0AAW2EXM2_9HYME